MPYTMNTDKTWAETRHDLEETMRLWEVRDWNIISEDRGSGDRAPVTVRFVLASGEEIRLTMADHWRSVDNLRVLYLGIHAMRLNEVRGIGSIMKEAYLQLAAPATTIDPYAVLGVSSELPIEDIEAVYKSKARRMHSDHGGSDEQMRDLNEAIELVRQRKAGGNG